MIKRLEIAIDFPSDIDEGQIVFYYRGESFGATNLDMIGDVLRDLHTFMHKHKVPMDGVAKYETSHYTKADRIADNADAKHDNRD